MSGEQQHSELIDLTEAARTVGLIASRQVEGNDSPAQLLEVGRVVQVKAADSEAPADSTVKFLIYDRSGKPAAFAHLSVPFSPRMVARNVERALDARKKLGSQMGESILKPVYQNEYNGLSLAIFPICRPLSDNRLFWRMQRPLVKRWALGWIRKLAEYTVHAPRNENERIAGFARPLEFLERMKGLNNRVRRDSLWALERLLQGRWSPRHVLMHGDFWKGNILVKRTGIYGHFPISDQLVVIDWATSEVDGYAFFDLMRIAVSLSVSSRILRKEVVRHCRILRCDPIESRCHLLAALGHRAQNLECFPVERFVEMAEFHYEKLLQVS